MSHHYAIVDLVQLQANIDSDLLDEYLLYSLTDQTWWNTMNTSADGTQCVLSCRDSSLQHLMDRAAQLGITFELKTLEEVQALVNSSTWTDE